MIGPPLNVQKKTNFTLLHMQNNMVDHGNDDSSPRSNVEEQKANALPGRLTTSGLPPVECPVPIPKV